MNKFYLMMLLVFTIILILFLSPNLLESFFAPSFCSVKCCHTINRRPIYGQ